jgi:AAA+ superfamily predicted ATPase
MSSIREKFILDDINFLPEDVVDYVIKEYIPDEYFMYTNKEYYTRCHHLLKHRIPRYEQYLQTTLRMDNNFVFEILLEENIDRWLRAKDYVYKTRMYKNYIYYIIDYCNEHSSYRCRSATINLLSKLGLCQNQHKKNVSRSIV